MIGGESNDKMYRRLRDNAKHRCMASPEDTLALLDHITELRNDDRDKTCMIEEIHELTVERNSLRDEIEQKTKRIDALENEFRSLFAEGLIDPDQELLHDRMGRRMRGLGLLPTKGAAPGKDRQPIRPCQDCGSDQVRIAVYLPAPSFNATEKMCRIECAECRFCGPLGFEGSLDSAIDCWNQDWRLTTKDTP